MTGSKSSGVEMMRRGQEIYDRVIAPTLRLEDRDRFVAIDLETEAFEIDPDADTAMERLGRRRPETPIWLMRVGHRPTYWIGYRGAYRGFSTTEPKPTLPERRYSLEETARRGREIYARVVKPALRPEDDDRFVAIDIETEEFEVGDDLLLTGVRLRARKPDAVIWMERVGRPGVVKFGGAWPRRPQ